VAFRLTPKEDSFYELFGVSAGHLVQAAKELTNLLAVETPEDRKAVVDRMHDLEHLGDEATHEIMRRVNSSFITPFDREDIYALASTLDDVMDFMEEAVDLTMLYEVEKLPGRMADQVDVLQRCAELTAEAMPKLKSMKGLEEYWIEINRLENQADSLHRKMVAALFVNTPDPINVIKVKAIVDGFEDAADAFEKVAHVVEGIAVKES
jgi:predicted phosphate transport protein (TIGR00153 family)